MSNNIGTESTANMIQKPNPIIIDSPSSVASISGTTGNLPHQSTDAQTLMDSGETRSRGVRGTCFGAAVACPG